MSSASQPESEFPRPYGRYELLERIGEGGMAEVFRARLPGVAGFEKILVIKRILPHLARNKRFVQMFVNEAQLAAKIQHQNVVQVYELGQLESGELYIAMEYVPGVDLRGILRAAAQRVLRIPVWFSVHAVQEILGGLSHAHELADDSGAALHVVHRDVTPSNVFVSKTGEVKLADFGIAKAAGQVSETRSGQLKGKISYMPPEQLHGQPLDGRADVFAVGVVLWECLTQRRLFGGRPDFETMLAICEGAREPPSRHNPKVPPELDAVTLSSIEPDREKRVPSAREFQARLLEILPKLRARLLPSEIRHVVEVLLGEKTPDPKLGADLPYEPTTDERPALSPQRTPNGDAARGVPQKLTFEEALKTAIGGGEALRPAPGVRPSSPPPAITWSPSAKPAPDATRVTEVRSGRHAAAGGPPSSAQQAAVVQPGPRGGPLHDPNPAMYSPAYPSPGPGPGAVSGGQKPVFPPPPPSYTPPPYSAPAQVGFQGYASMAPARGGTIPPTPAQPPAGFGAPPANLGSPGAALPPIGPGPLGPPPNLGSPGAIGPGSLSNIPQIGGPSSLTGQNPLGGNTLGSPNSLGGNTLGSSNSLSGPNSLAGPGALGPNTLGGPLGGARPGSGGYVALMPQGSAVHSGTLPPAMPPAMAPVLQQPAAASNAPPTPTPTSLPTVPPSFDELSSTPKPRRRRGTVDFETDEEGDLKVSDSTESWGNTGLTADYTGPFPFFTRTADGKVEGPMDYDAMVKVSNPREGSAIKEISADGKTWRDIREFGPLAGLDFLAPDTSALRNVVMVGKLEQRSLVQVLFRIARGNHTGRLVIMDRGSGPRVARREVDVVKGAPTFVYADRLDLQLPSLILKREIANNDLVHETVHLVAKRKQPLEDILSRRATMDVSRHRPLFMRDRLAEIFTWTTGKYAFDEAIVPRSTNAFAPSLLHVIVESVYRAFTRDRLLEKVDRFMNKKLQRSERFEEVIDQMDLTKPQLSAAERLAEGKPLAQLLKKHANDSQLFLLMTYVLTEMDLLLAPLE